jgi:hypothetical protein
VTLLHIAVEDVHPLHFLFVFVFASWDGMLPRGRLKTYIPERWMAKVEKRLQRYRKDD